MSITSDVRSYADAAVEQGKQVVDQAQSRLTGVASDATELAGKVSGTATEVAEKVQGHAQGLTGKAIETAGELRTFGETLYERVIAWPVVETVASSVEPYLGQLKEYGATVTERIEEFYADLKKNDQVAKALDSAEFVAGAVIDTVSARVVKPVRSYVEGATGAAAASTEPAPSTAEQAAPTRTTTVKATPAKRTAPRRPATKA
jgi:hypothetical protein